MPAGTRYDRRFSDFSQIYTDVFYADGADEGINKISSLNVRSEKGNTCEVSLPAGMRNGGMTRPNDAAPFDGGCEVGLKNISAVQNP